MLGRLRAAAGIFERGDEAVADRDFTRWDASCPGGVEVAGTVGLCLVEPSLPFCYRACGYSRFSDIYRRLAGQGDAGDIIAAGGPNAVGGFKRCAFAGTGDANEVGDRGGAGGQGVNALDLLIAEIAATVASAERDPVFLEDFFGDGGWYLVAGVGFGSNSLMS